MLYSNNRNPRTRLPYGFWLFLLCLTSVLYSSSTAIGEVVLIGKPALLEHEQAWLHAHPRLRYCFSPMWRPYDYFYNGKHKGVFKDYLDLFAQKLGVTFIPVPTIAPHLVGKGWQQALDFVKDRKCDFLAGAVRTADRDKYLNFTTPYFNVTQVLIALPDKHFISSLATMRNQTIGIPPGTAIGQFLRRDFPKMRLVPLDTDNAANALDQGKIYAYIIPLEHAISWLDERLHNYKIIGKLEYPYPISVAIRNDWPELLPIMNKVIASIKQAEHNSIQNHWAPHILQQHVNYTLLWQLAGIAILIISIMLYWNRRLAREILQRQQAETQLRKLSSAVDQSHNTVVITDLDANIEFANPAFTRVTGYTLDEVIGNNPRILHSGEHSQEFYCAMWDTLTKGNMWHGELHNKRKDGTLYWENATISPVKDNNGKITHYVAVKENITERKQHEKLIYEHSKQLNDAQRVAKIGSWHISLPDNGLSWSDQTYRMFGVALNTPVNINDFFAKIHPDDQAQVSDAWQAALTGKPYEIEHRIVVDEQVYWVIERAEIQFNANGEAISGIGTVQDITERKHIENALHKSQTRYQRLVAAMAEGLLMQNQAGEIITCNAAAERILGLKQTQMLGHTFLATDWQAIHEDGTPFFYTDYPVVVSLSTGKPTHNTIMGILKPNSEPLWILLNVEPLFYDDETKPYAVVVTFMDITARKRAERLQALNEARLDALLRLSRQAPNMNEDELFRSGLEDAERLTGSTIGYLHFINDDQETIQLGFWSRSTMAQCNVVSDKHYPISQGGIWVDGVRQHTPLIHNDYQNMGAQRMGLPAGHVHLVRHMNAPVIENCQVKMLIGVGNKATPYDESDLRQLQLIAEDLWRIITRRRTELALEQARQVAESASHAKSTFLAHTSHELRTPLNGILGFAQLLLADPTLGTTQREHIRVISRSGEHLLNLINDILDLARIEAGKLDLHPEPVQLTCTLSDVVAIIRVRAEAKGLQLKLDWHVLPDAIIVDNLRLNQILLNLLGNAVKFTKRGEIKFWLHTQSTEQPNLIQLMIAIADSGPGIPATRLRHILKPFERAPDHVEEGTGLGLSISSMLIAKMGGEFCLGSQTTSGTWFATTTQAPPIPLLTPSGTIAWFSLMLPTATTTETLNSPIANPPDPNRNILHTVATIKENINASIPITPVEMTTPDFAILERVRVLALAGDIWNLEQLCETIEGAYPQFTAKVRQYIEQFELNELNTFLDNVA